MSEKKALNVDIGKRIKEERNRVGLSREKLAELVDVSPRFIADVERGTVGISVSTLKAICEVLSISSDRLIWGDTTVADINSRLRFLDADVVDVIDKTVQCQLELISLLDSKNNSGQN